MKRILSIVVIALVLLLTPNAFAGKGYSSGGGRSYSSSSRSSFSSSKSNSSFSRSYSSPKISSGPSLGKSYSSKPTQSTGPPKSYSSKSSSSSGKKPEGSFQSKMASEQKKVESRLHYQQATAPKESYTTPKGNKVTIKKDDPKIIQIRSLPQEKWVNRETRVHTFYHHYYVNPPTTVVHYNDPYNTFFWLWLMDRSLNERAYWAYNHRYDPVMDQARYRDLLARDRALENRVKQLEAENKIRDPNYVPPGIEPDLQYTDDYIDAAMNPQQSGIGFFHALWVLVKWCFYIAIFISLVAFLVWFIFYKDW
jgi:hypothetical protein